MMKTSLRALVAAGAIALAASAFASAPATTKDIMVTAQAAGSFSTLLEAVEKAGLADTLRGQGPFTIFAPTDEAFSKVPKEQLDALLADRATLKAVRRC